MSTVFLIFGLPIILLGMIWQALKELFITGMLLWQKFVK